MSVFSERLEALREEKNLSQSGAAKALEIGVRTYQYYEYAQREPQLSVLIRMADFYGVSLDYLAGRRDDR